MAQTRNPNKRVVITGIGAVSGLGHTSTELWDGLKKGVCGIRELTFFDCSKQRTKLAAQVPDFLPKEYFSSRQIQRYSRCDMLGLIAAREALQNAGLSESIHKKEFNARRSGVVLGAGAGGSRNGEIYYRQVKKFGFRQAKPSLLLSYAPSATTDLLASEFQLMGFRSTIVTACSSSNTAMGLAADEISSGRADFIVTGGSDALSELTYSGFNALKAISPSACRPFDRNRDGLSLGEAAGILVFEEFEHAKKRGAKVYAEFLGYGLSGDAYHMTAPEPGGSGALAAMRNALENSGVRADQVDYISAHGTATPHNDLAEAKAICDLFGIEGKICTVPVSALKSMLGHCLGACGAIEAVALTLTLWNDCIPPTIHHQETDPECLIDCVPNVAREKKLKTVISNSFAFGGNNTSIVMQKLKETA